MNFNSFNKFFGLPIECNYNIFTRLRGVPPPKIWDFCAQRSIFRNFL